MKRTETVSFIYSLLLVVNTHLFVSCSSTSVPGEPKYHKTEVLERMGNVKDTPEWSLGSKAMFEENGYVVFVNTASMSADSRPEACTRGAEESGRANMLRYIKDIVTTSGQMAELSSTEDPGIEALTTFLAMGNLSGVNIKSRYWEKRVESDPIGARVLKIYCAAQVAVLKPVLDKQLRAVINGSSGDLAVREKLLNAQKQFIENIAKYPSPADTDENE